MATDLTYNGVILKNVVTRGFEQEPVTDESGTDVLYQKFVVSVETIANVDLLLAANPSLGISGTGVGGGTAGQVAQSARLRLAEFRGEFKYTMEGVDILTAGPAAVDANNGPKPRLVRITNVSPNTLRIQFTIEVCKVDCTENPSAVINNRWSCGDDVDEHFRTTRVWRGRLRLCSAAYNPHAFRGVVVPRIARGWKRTRMHFNVPPNSLELEYYVQDVEMLGESPPDPAVKMSLVHTESMSVAGMSNMGSITLRLDGHRLSDKRAMIEKAMQIVIAKLAINQLTPTQGILKELQITDFAGESQNGVQVQAMMTRIPGDLGTASGLGAILAKTIGAPLRTLNIEGYDPDRPVTVGPYGTAGATAAGMANLFACYLQSPCNDVHGMPQVSGVTENPPPEEDEQDPAQATYTEQPGNTSLYTPDTTQDHLDAKYEFTKLESILELSANRLALPVAAASTSPLPTMAVVRLSRPTAKRRIIYSAERVGKNPQMWLPSDFVDVHGITHSLLSWIPNVQAPQQNSIGEPMHAVDAEYVYVLSRPPLASESLSVGSLPWDTRTPAENEYPASEYLQPQSGTNGLI